MTRTEFVRTVSRSRGQAAYANALLNGESINPTENLRGRAKSYSSKYYCSFMSVVDRMRALEVQVRALPLGPRGGQRFVITSMPTTFRQIFAGE